MGLATLLQNGAPDDPALLDVEGSLVSYQELTGFVAAAAGTLRALGVSPGDTAAILLPNGPAMATTFLAAASAGIAAPLNPAYRREELEFYLGDLDARLLVIAAGLESPAREVARARGIPVVELAPGPAGRFTLDGRAPGDGAVRPAEPSATALILHTSGTTSRPKMVPLSHANLMASAANVARTLALGPGDRCLNVMPLFHIHGLVAALLASLRAGGSVLCSPGFSAPRFFGWLAAGKATWYTAVPTIHQAIVARAGEPEARAALAAAPLRFARSSSAALPRRTLAELEAAMGAPVLEAYGMTEAAHQMASNPLAGPRKPGSVGRAAGPEIAVMDAGGALLPAGQRGEVVIRGPNVTAGYLHRPEANAAAFTNGWFRTGDEGHLDEDGYLWLGGRLKEQINRGGEKISPLEVDEVLMEHPAVAQALSFAVPHPLLGEDVAAAVVVRPGAQAGERALRDHVAARLAYFKVPRRIVQVEAIPTGPSGKLQRLGLAERLGLRAEPIVDDAGDTTPPGTPVEEVVASVWEEVLGRPAPAIRRNFFTLGGDSLAAVRIVARLRELVAVDVPLHVFFDAPTVAGLAAAIDAQLAAEPTP